MNHLEANVSRFWLGLLAVLLSLSLLVVLLPPAAAAVPGNGAGEPLAFEYQGNEGWWSSTQYNIGGGTTGKVVTGDFNGDGVDEVAALYALPDNARWIVWISSRIGFDGGDLAYPWWVSADGEYNAGATSWRVVAGDFNGDGLDDVAAMYDYGNDLARWHVWLSTGASFTYQGNPGWWSSSGYTAGNATFRVVAGDFDGDGLDDVAAMYDYGNDVSRWHAWLSTGASFTYSGTAFWWSNSEYNAGDVRARVVAGDFDGDGLDDVAAMYDYGNDLARWHVWLSTGTSFTYQGNPGWWRNSEYTATDTTGRVVAEDFDGDGLDDVAAMYDYGNDLTRWHVWLSTGASFTYQGNRGWWSNSEYTAGDTTGRVVAGDYDGDSIADVAAIYDYGDVGPPDLANWHVWLSNAPNQIFLPITQR